MIKLVWIIEPCNTHSCTIVKEGLREALYYQCNHSTVFPLCAVEVVVVILLASSSSNSVRGAEQQMFAVWYGRGEQNDDIFQQQQQPL